jgi:hypothetical protein
MSSPAGIQAAALRAAYGIVRKGWQFCLGVKWANKGKGKIYGFSSGTVRKIELWAFWGPTQMNVLMISVSYRIFEIKLRSKATSLFDVQRWMFDVHLLKQPCTV